MLGRLIETKEPLRSIVEEDDLKAWSFASKPRQEEKDDVERMVNSGLWWEGIKVVLHVFSPIHVVLRLVDSGQPITGTIKDRMEELIEKAWRISNPIECPELSQLVWEIITLRWKRDMKTNLHTMARGLNPANHGRILYLTND